MPRSLYWPFGENSTSSGQEGPSILHKQLGDMQGEVTELQSELAAVKKDRLDLLNRKHAVSSGESEVRYKSPERRDAYSEITRLKDELQKYKHMADHERFQKEKYEEKLRDLETRLNDITMEKNKMASSFQNVEPRRYTTDETATLKSQLRDLKEEMEEMNICLTEKAEQVQEYRVKYLQAEQQAEELRRQLESIEYDNKQVSDQIHIEIQKMKMQFQEKLHELSPLPDLLKGAQMQLQEAKQLQRLAEDSSQQLSNELQRVKEKLVLTVNHLNKEKADSLRYSEEMKALRVILDEKQTEMNMIVKELEEVKCKAMRMEERLSQTEQRYQEKASECTQLLRDLEELREESSRSIARNKERSESLRRCLKTQVTELERQLVQSRAQCRACQKERDEIRQRMSLQLNGLQENYEMVEMRYRALQEQVCTMKKSYTYMLADCCDTVVDFDKSIAT